MKTLILFGLTAAALGAMAWVSGESLLAGGAPQVGQKAPEIEAKDEDGKAWKSSDVVGKKILVVYFYPADFTGGCTSQACGFRDNFDAIKGKNIEVVGVSGDSPKNHKLFKQEYKLPFTLLADEDGSIAKKFGVPVGKGGTAKGKDTTGVAVTLTRGVTISRYTAVIDQNGNLAALYAVKDAAGDHKKVLETVQKLQK